MQSKKSLLEEQELQSLVMPSKKPEGFQRFMLELDEQVNVKLLMRVWGPRLEFVVRLMLVATFFDDSFHTAMNFSEHANRVSEQGCLKWLASPEEIGLIATVALGAGLLAQWIGSLFLLSVVHPNGATAALIAWTIAQPFLYGQVSNFEFAAESLSLLGGLLMLRVHLVFEQEERYGSWVQLLGRLLLPSAYLYHAGRYLYWALTPETTEGVAAFVSSLSEFLVNSVEVIALLLGATLVAAGLKSRAVALFLAIVNLGFVFYQHPFFLFIRYEDGEWKYNEDKMTIPEFAMPTGVLIADFDTSQIYELHRYYFFLGLSTSGALLLLTQFGPGDMAIQKDEPLLPVAVVNRARD